MRNSSLLAAVCLLTFAAISTAQEYPSRPVRIIVPYSPGGSNDVVGRLIAGKLSVSMGQQCVVDNRPGAGGTVGAGLAARAEPDGYTLLVASAGAITTAPSMYSALPFDPMKDLAAITNIVLQPNVLVVHPSVPARTVKDFTALTRANPGKLSYGSSGIGATQHLASELFSMMTGAQIVHIPYKGGGPAMVGIRSGEIDFMFSVLPTAVPLIKSGQLRAIAVTTARRVKVFPDLPTVDESGLPGFEISGFIGMLAPGRVPQPVLKKLNAEVAKAMTPDVQERLVGLGLEVDVGTPEKFTAFLQEDIARYAKIVKAAKIPVR